MVTTTAKGFTLSKTKRCLGELVFVLYLLKKTLDISVTPPLNQKLTPVIVSSSVRGVVCWQLQRISKPGCC